MLHGSRVADPGVVRKMLGMCAEGAWHVRCFSRIGMDAQILWRGTRFEGATAAAAIDAVTQVRTTLLAVALLVAASHASARTRGAPSCRRACREAVQDCKALSGGHICRRNILVDCRLNGPTTCLEAKVRAAQCSEECSDVLTACSSPSQCEEPGDLIRACRTTDEGLARCHDAKARGDRCRGECADGACSGETCSPFHYQTTAFAACLSSEAGSEACRLGRQRAESCRQSCDEIQEDCIATGDDPSQCASAVQEQCFQSGVAYCTDAETVNGCNRVVAADLRGESTVEVPVGYRWPSRETLAIGCILVSPGTVLTNGVAVAAKPCDRHGRFGWLCIFAGEWWGAVFYGGTPNNPDWSEVQGPGESRVVWAPGMFGYIRVTGRGAVIVD